MEKQTAVEKLRDAFYSYATQDVRSVDNNRWIIEEWIFEDLVEQAQEVLKQQIIDAWHTSLNIGDYRNGKQYYNETYGKDKSES